jgi:L-arabinose isomerase
MERKGDDVKIKTRIKENQINEIYNNNNNKFKEKEDSRGNDSSRKNETEKAARRTPCRADGAQAAC